MAKIIILVSTIPQIQMSGATSTKIIRVVVSNTILTIEATLVATIIHIIIKITTGIIRISIKTGAIITTKTSSSESSTRTTATGVLPRTLALVTTSSRPRIEFVGGRSGRGKVWYSIPCYLYLQ